MAQNLLRYERDLDSPMDVWRRRRRHSAQYKLRRFCTVAKTASSRLLPTAIIGGAGIFSGITGLGGGIITVSAFTLCTDLTYKQALGTSLCAMVLPASVGAITHHFNGNVVWRVAPYLAAGAGFGAYGGGTIGSNLPEKELKYCFSAAMIALGTRVLLRA